MLLSVAASAQGPSASPAPGLRVYGVLNSTDTYLVDNTGAIVHTWPSQQVLATSLYVLADGSLLRTIPDGVSPAPGGGGGVQRLAFDGTLLWDYRYNGPGVLSHHDLAPLPNGNVLLIAWEDKTAAEAIANGRDPALMPGAVFRPDHIVEVQPTGPTTGAIVWEWHVWDHLIQDHDPAVANFGNVGAHPELVDINYPPVANTVDDWNHGNGIDYDPIHDRILLSVRTQSEVWVIDHGTTTAEAASHSGGRWGRGGDLLYRWGSPAAYRDTAPQILSGQHAPTFIVPGRPGAGHVMVFDNLLTNSDSAVYEFALPMDASGALLSTPTGLPQAPTIVWSYTAPGFFSPVMSNAERLPNGNTLICNARDHALREVDPAGAIVWQHTAPNGFVFHSHYVERSLWASAKIVDAQNGGMVDLELRLGTMHAGDNYLLLASGSGTTPGISVGMAEVLPLNPDPWFYFSVIYADYPGLLDDTLGTLSANGSGTGHFRIVPGILRGLDLNFAAVTFDVAGTPTAVTNPTPVRIGW
ncbi:MAG: aryl-sulfate sulfotransferase [Planctomycetes bacterium]|nr:aryl-sulfate sulfotransferase [Planctomycetota bacterium]MCB9886415.1 aryl-sulfate sulfotransferase [Planctomycetota bacterium]